MIILYCWNSSQHKINQDENSILDIDPNNETPIYQNVEDNSGYGEGSSDFQNEFFGNSGVNLGNQRYKSRTLGGNYDAQRNNFGNEGDNSDSERYNGGENSDDQDSNGEDNFGSNTKNRANGNENRNGCEFEGENFNKNGKNGENEFDRIRPGNQIRRFGSNQNEAPESRNSNDSDNNGNGDKNVQNEGFGLRCGYVRCGEFAYRSKFGRRGGYSRCGVLCRRARICRRGGLIKVRSRALAVQPKRNRALFIRKMFMKEKTRIPKCVATNWDLVTGSNRSPVFGIRKPLMLEKLITCNKI
ncbi:hypothetical protein AYI69_g5656 [Smittium culicis]|uniref:Uncharacterized protein n=1 Tax=Smittium culicis TaxID=133412 RepID=A0A1R1Y4D8_9FUNG|nr:hypothetical protein AYI69_g5656 [Smittium culicis]